MKTAQMDLDALAQEVHKRNEKWWQNIDTGEPISRNAGELLMLVLTELAEATEGERKDLMDDKLPHRKMAEVEMADAYIRLLDFSAGFRHPLIWVETSALCAINNKAACLLEISKLVCEIDGCPLPSFCISGCLGMIREYCIRYGYDLESAMAEKLAYNSTRVDHTHEARRIAGGKQF